MSASIPRRHFIHAAALSAATLPFWPRLSLALGKNPGATIRLQPFDLHDVRLHAGPVLEALQVNRRYLMGLDPDRLLHTFRITAALPTTATPLGGWEAP